MTRWGKQLRDARKDKTPKTSPITPKQTWQYFVDHYTFSYFRIVFCIGMRQIMTLINLEGTFTSQELTTFSILTNFCRILSKYR